MSEEAETRLAEAIAAARDGRAVQARTLLRRLLEADAGDERAWYWLGRVAESPAERLVCLESVLRLDPGHTRVQAEAAALRRELREAEREQHPSGSPVAAAVPATAAEELAAAAAVEPLGCPWCGATTAATDRLCPACGHTLYLRRRKSAEHSVYSLLLVAGWFSLANHAWLGLSGYYFTRSLVAAAQGSPAAQGTFRTLGTLLGRQGGQGPAWLDWPLLPALLLGGIAFGLSLIVAWGLYRRLAFFYWLTVALLLAYPLSVVYRLASGDSLPLGELVPGLVLFVLSLLTAFMAHDEYAWVENRLDAGVDGDVDSHSALHARGRDYARRGMWAKAASHWSRAVACSPGHPDYRVALATAYLNLGHAERARDHLLAAQRIDPQHDDVARLLAAIEAGPPPL